MAARFTTAEALAEQLRRDGGYRTVGAAPRYRRWMATIRMHLRIQRSFIWAARISKRGAMNDTNWAAASIPFLRQIEDSGGRIEIEGIRNLQACPTPAVIVANHMGTLETIGLPSIILPFRRIAFVIKTSLLTYPIFGHTMRAVPHIAVDRVNPRDDLQQVLTKGTDLLRSGISVILFPQATRSLEFNTAEFNSLGAKLARRAGVPLLPLALKTDFLTPGRWHKDLSLVYPDRTVHFAFGPHIAVTGNGKMEHRQLVDFITGRLTAWGATIRQRTGVDDDT